MKIDWATAISLDVWKDPQGYVLIEHVRDEAWLYFRCWESIDGKPTGHTADYVGCLHFSGVWHLGSSRFREARAYPHVENNKLSSYYLIVKNSSLLESLQRQRTAYDPDWKKYDMRNYRHWVVESHDFYTEIVASHVSFLKLEGKNAERCFAIWDKV